MNPATVYLDGPDARMDSVGSSDMQQSNMNRMHAHRPELIVHAAPRQHFQKAVDAICVGKGERDGVACHDRGDALPARLHAVSRKWKQGEPGVSIQSDRVAY